MAHATGSLIKVLGNLVNSMICKITTRLVETTRECFVCKWWDDCVQMCSSFSSQTSTGSYLMFQSNAAAVQSTYIISTTQNVTFDKDHCLTMWYFEDGEDPFSLQVYMVLPHYNTFSYQFSSAIENRRRWNLLKADIQYNPGYNTNCKR